MFRFLPGDLSALAQANVPEDVIKAMAAKANNRPIPGAVGSPPPPVATTAAARQATQPGQAQSAAPIQFQDRGMWDVDFDGSVSIPHSSVADTSGFVSGGLGYFVSRGSEIGFIASGLFVNGGQDVTLGGFYRYYFRTNNSRLLPFLGGAAGGNIAHVSGFGTNSNFAALGQAGIRIFAARHVAFEVGYDLVYVRVAGLGFSDSSFSQISIGFAHVFGR